MKAIIANIRLQDFVKVVNEFTIHGTGDWDMLF